MTCLARIHACAAIAGASASGDRLVAFQGVTVTNGETIEVRGIAQGDRFVISLPWGSVVAPATVVPSNPWSLRFIRADWVMNTRTGTLQRVRVTGGEVDTISLAGATMALSHYLKAPSSRTSG